MSNSTYNRTVIRLTKKSLKILLHQTINEYLQSCINEDEDKELVIDRLANETFENNWEDYNYESGDSEAEVERPKPRVNMRNQFIAEMVPKIRAANPDITHREAFKQAVAEWREQKKAQKERLRQL